MLFRFSGANVLRCAFAVAFMVVAQGASASEFCNIKRTPDGFVALRAAPDAKAKRVARMTHGDEVLGDPTVENRDGWMFVTWWKGGRWRKGRYEFDKPSGKGWMNTRFIDELCG